MQQVISGMLKIYRLQWAVSVLAFFGLAFAVRTNELCSRGYLPTAEELELGAEDPLGLQPLGSSCGNTVLVKAGSTAMTVGLLVVMTLQFRYRIRLAQERERLAIRIGGLQQKFARLRTRIN